uniref:C2H2-type domain-containing protein n=1 Tax=viral metagenome TaxID=1070528 RepID=A0A6C0HGY8_9ZZZZ
MQTPTNLATNSLTTTDTITTIISKTTYQYNSPATNTMSDESDISNPQAAAATTAEPESDDGSCISDDGENAIVCLICRHTFASNTQRAIHMRMAHGADEEPHTCTECDRLFWSKAEHGNHMAIWHPVATKPVSMHLDSSVSAWYNGEIAESDTQADICCEICNTAIPVDQSLRHELRCRPAAAAAPVDDESSEKTNYCQRCNIQFDNFGDYMQHDAHCLDYNWPGDEGEYYPDTYYCQNCGLEHATITLRDEHQATCIYENNEYRCDCCGTEVFNNMDTCLEHEISCWKDFEKEERREARLHSFSRK